jgi:hypothetical protein
LKIRMRSVLAGAAAAAVAATFSVLVGAGAAHAATPTFEPDPGAIGSLTFYDAAGAPITGGSLTASPFVAFAAASGPGRAGDNRATLFAATPKANTPTSNFVTDFMTGSSPYPVAAPPPVAALTNPVATGPVGGPSLADYIASNPNTETAPNLANIYQIRLVTSGPGIGANPQYFRTDIFVDQAAGTWRVEFPAAVAATSTTLSASPANTAPAGQQVTLTAHVTPTNTAGSVHFFDGTTDLGAGTYTQSTGTATFQTSTLALGNHSLTAQFTPADPTAFSGSTSSAVAYSITSPKTPTSTTLSATPPSPATLTGSNTTLPVNLTAHVTPLGTAGSVHFFDGSTDLGAGTYSTTTGDATMTVNLSQGSHPLTATFTPADTGTFDPSTSAILTYVVVGSNSAGITLDANETSGPFAGALSLQVAVTKVDLTQVDPTTAAGHPVLPTDPTGHRHAFVFTGNLGGVSVNDTRPDPSPTGHGLGWTLNGQTSQFTNAGPPPVNFPASYLGWTPALATGGDAEGTVSAGASVDSKLKTDASTGLSTSRVLATAAAGNGLGRQNLSSGLELRIPDTAPAGHYLSTLTLTLVSP